MASEYWATLSIYDHRADYFRPSMLLFDRIVIPVPSHPWKDLGPAERDALDADARYLEDHGCAIRLDWDPNAFAAWERDNLAVSASIGKTDRLLNTRYQLKWLIEKKALGGVEIPPGVEAMPVFASRETYLAQDQELLDEDASRQATIELILAHLPVPAPDTPLEDIIRLRDQGFVHHQVRKLRQWQLGLLTDLEAAGADPQRWKLRLDRAEADLRAAVDDYRQAMSNVLEAQQSARFTTLFSVLSSPVTALGRLFSEHRDDFRLVGQHERSWKALYEKPYAYAGVICSADQLGG